MASGTNLFLRVTIRRPTSRRPVRFGRPRRVSTRSGTPPGPLGQYRRPDTGTQGSQWSRPHFYKETLRGRHPPRVGLGRTPETSCRRTGRLQDRHVFVVVRGERLVSGVEAHYCVWGVYLFRHTADVPEHLLVGVWVEVARRESQGFTQSWVSLLRLHSLL